MINIKNINKTYYSLNGDSSKALNNVSLEFGEKGLVFITGKSGSGKSTLLNILGGLDEIDSGDIKIKDKSSSNFTKEDFDSYRNTYLGFIFQDFGILENLTVAENIGLALKLQSYKRKMIKEKVNEIINLVGLSGYGKRTSNELSGGQLQRVSIARALIKNPEIILADEPTGNLDSNTGTQIMNLLKKLSETKLVIVVSHDIDFAYQYADRIITLKDGSIIEDNKVTKKIVQRKISVPKKIDYVVEDSNVKGDFKLSKTSLPFKYIFKSAKNSIFRRKVKLIYTIFLFTISLFTLSISTLVSNYDISKSMLSTMKYNNEDSILLKKCDDFAIDYTKVYNVDECLFRNIIKVETDEVSNLANEYNATTYNLVDKLVPLQTENPYYYPPKIYGFIEIPKNNIFEIIEGTYPKAKNEVLITEYLIEPIKEAFNINNDLIGSTILYSGEVLKITGIIDTDHEQFEYLKNIDMSKYNEDELKKVKDDIKKLSLAQEKMYSRLFKAENTNIIIEDYVEDVKLWTKEKIFLGYFNFATKDYLVNKDMVYYPNEEPQLGDNEIYIDLNFFLERILSYQNETDLNNYTINNILNDLTILDEFIGKTYTINYEYKNVMFSDDLKINGFFMTDNQNVKNTIIANINTISKIPMASNSYDGYYLELSNSTKDNVKLIHLLNDKGNIQISPYSNDLYFVSGVTKDLHKTLYYVTSGLAFFSCLLIFVSISNSIIDKQKDIGILMSIGTKGTDIGLIFIIESIILALISSIMAVVGAFITTYIINQVLIDYFKENILFFHFGITEIFYVVLLATLMSVISTIVPFFRLVLMRPINVVRKK